MKKFLLLTVLFTFAMPCFAQTTTDSSLVEFPNDFTVPIQDSTYVMPTLPATGNMIFDKLAPILLPLILTFLAGLKGKVQISEKIKPLASITIGTGLIVVAGYLGTGWFMVVLCFAGAVGGIFGITGIRKFYWNYSGALRSNTVVGYGVFLGVTVATIVINTLHVDIPILNSIFMIIQLLGGSVGLYGIFDAAFKTNTTAFVK